MYAAIAEKAALARKEVNVPVGVDAGRDAMDKGCATMATRRVDNKYEDDLHRGAELWYRDADAGGRWTLGELIRVVGSRCTVRVAGAEGGEITVARGDVCSSNPAFLEGCANLTRLTYLNEPSILHNVAVRYAEDKIYTNAGSILVAVNPFKRLPIYADANAMRYGRQDGNASEELEPHIFQVAQRSFDALFDENRGQSIVISGESGSGKTENTKFVMSHLTWCSTSAGIDQALLKTNPILEAFGNAKTLRNDNSSRFGKLINIYFASKTKMSGANIHTYLLEKSRVVSVPRGERSYHIFYQLLKGASDQERRALGVATREASDFAYLRQSGCSEIGGVNDGRDFADLRDALRTFGLGPDDQTEIFKLLAGILWLGNVTFAAEDTSCGEQASIENPEMLQTAAGLFGVDAAQLASVLTTRTITARNEKVAKVMDVSQAVTARDNLAKYVYNCLFQWLVKHMNAYIGNKKTQGHRDMYLLDIYGFEAFETNSFEQVCINYANERLQQLFNKGLIQLEQEEYEEEGLQWTEIAYEGNDRLIALFEARDGFINVLSDEINVPQSSDATLARRLRDQFDGHACFRSNARHPTKFSITHYPGVVEYDCDTFLDKNRDFLHPNLVDLTISSPGSLLCTVVQAGKAIQTSQSPQKRRQSIIRQQAVASTFKGQLSSLVDTLSKTSVRYVRCIKPNKQQRAQAFESDLVLHQLKCCGVFEVVKMSRHGYPTKFKYADFNARYSLFLDSTFKGLKGNAKEMCKAILTHFNIDPSQYQMGESKVFLRAGALGKVSELQRLWSSSIITLQSTWRGYVQKRKYRATRHACIRIQSGVRGRLARRSFRILIKQNHSATVIQSSVRMHWAKRRASQLRLEAARKRDLEAQRRREKEAKEASRSKKKKKAREREPIAKEEGAEMGVETAAAAAPGVAATVVETTVVETPMPASKAALGLAESKKIQAELARLRTENIALRASLEQEKGLKLDYAEQLIMTEASYAQEFQAMRQTIGAIRKYLADAVGASFLQTCANVKQLIDKEAGYFEGGGGEGEAKLPSHAEADVGDGIQCLSHEFNSKTRVFDDDMEFIREVTEGRAKPLAAMDPEYELKNLHLRYANWKDDFKKRMSSLSQAVQIQMKKKNAEKEYEGNRGKGIKFFRKRSKQ